MNPEWLILLTTFFLAALISGALVPVVIRLAIRKRLLSPLDFRRKDRRRTPLLGGVAVFTSISLVTLIFGVEAFYLSLACALPIFVIGVLDDIFQFSARPKALVHFAAVAIWLAWVPSEQLLLSRVGLDPWLLYPLAAFWMLGLINAINMIDGMDGEAGGFTLVVCLMMALILGFTGASLPLAIVGGASLGFLIFNWPPARIYLGDGGSTSLGFLLAATALQAPFPGDGPALLLVPLFLFAFPEVDAVLSMSRRLKSKSSMFSGDHDHIHHKLRKLGLSVPQSLLVIYSAAAYCGLTAFTLSRFQQDLALVLVSVLALGGLMVLLGAVYFLEFRQAHQVSNVSRSMLHRYLSITPEPDVDPSDFQAWVYDLLPYYKELQMRGVSEVDSFVRAFSTYVQTQHNQAQYCLIGSYSMVVIEPRAQKQDEFSQRQSKAQLYYRLLNEFSVVKSESPIPWGMAFYSSSSKGEQFLRKFGLLREAKVQVQLEQVG